MQLAGPSTFSPLSSHRKTSESVRSTRAVVILASLTSTLEASLERLTRIAGTPGPQSYPLTRMERASSPIATDVAVELSDPFCDEHPASRVAPVTTARPRASRLVNRLVPSIRCSLWSCRDSSNVVHAKGMADGSAWGMVGPTRHGTGAAYRSPWQVGSGKNRGEKIFQVQSHSDWGSAVRAVLPSGIRKHII